MFRELKVGLEFPSLHIALVELLHRLFNIKRCIIQNENLTIFRRSTGAEKSELSVVISTRDRFGRSTRATNGFGAVFMTMGHLESKLRSFLGFVYFSTTMYWVVTVCGFHVHKLDNETDGLPIL